VPDVQAIVNATIEHVIGELLEAARDPERIGSRVLMIDHELRSEKAIATLSQRDLAKELGVSAPAVNNGLARARGILARLKQVNFSQIVGTGNVTSDRLENTAL
jgi:Trp operon repressor